MPLPKHSAWFPRKSYGWGWGLPSRWQGWVVFALYGAALTAAILLVPAEAVATRVGTIVCLSALLVAVCYWKGETPRWSWGDADRDPPPDDRRP